MARGRPLLQFQSRAFAIDRRMKFVPPNDFEYISNWTALSPRDKVYVVKDDVLEFGGLVDAVTDDGAIVWLYSDGGAGRRLFVRAEGDVVWRRQDKTVS